MTSITTTMPRARGLSFALGLFCSLGAWSGMATAVDYDATLSVGNTSVTKPQTGSATLDFTVTRSGDTSFPVQADYATADDTARAGTDYSARSGRVFIPAGATSATVSVPVLAGASTQTRDMRLGLTAAYSGLPAFDRYRSYAMASNPSSVALGDVNGDGRPDLATANRISNNVSVLLNATASGASLPSFTARQDFATGTGPIAVAAGDINGDGRADLAAANYDGDTVSVLLSTTASGASTPSFAARQDLATGTRPYSVALGDLNGDGRADLAVANANSNTVSVFLSTTASGASTPSFTTRQDLATGSGPAFVALGDLNGDGRKDLTVVNAGSYTVSVFLNTTASGAGAPSFASRQDFASGVDSKSVALGDINGDGRPDLAVGKFSGTGVSVLLNTTVSGASTPSFAPRQEVATDINPSDVELGDLDGDGRADLAVVGGGVASVLLNTTASGAGVPSFAGGQHFGPGNVWSVALGDINGDGRPDLAVAGNNVSVLLNTTASVASTSSFTPRRNFPVGAAPYSVAPGDLNGDGRADLVVANYNSNSVSVLLSTTASGAGTPDFATAQDFATDTAPYSVALGDLNDDGRPDLLVANASSGTASVFLNTTASGASTSSFAPRQDFATGTNPYSVALGDINGDGRPDLVVAKNSSANTVAVLLNTTASGSGTPSFAARQDFGAGTSPVSVAVGDFNGDGRADLAVVNTGGNNVSVLLNTTASGASTPSFATRQDFVTGPSPYSVALGDFNGDGRADLAVTNRNSSTVSVLLNTTVNGAAVPSFATRRDFGTDSNPHFVAAGDVDGDGRPDLAVANTNSSTVSVLLNTTANGASTSSFTPRRDFVADAAPRSVALGDFDGDGRSDLAVANSSYGNNVSVLLGTLYRASLSGLPGVGTIFANTSTDQTPTPFSYVNQTGAPSNAAVTTSTRTITGINVPVSVSVTSPGRFSVNGAAFQSSAATINAGDSIALQLTGAAAGNTTVSTTLTVGTYSTSWSVTTNTDRTPVSFGYVNQTGVPPNQLRQTGTRTVTGINVPVPVSVTAPGRFSINGGAFQSSAATLNPGDTVALQLTSAATANTAVSTTLTVGTYSTNWSVTTAP